MRASAAASCAFSGRDAAPHLEPVAEPPVGVVVCEDRVDGRNLRGAGAVEPALLQQALALPHAPLQIELRKAGHVLRGEEIPRAAALHPVGEAQAAGVFDAQGREEPRLQELGQRHAGLSAQDGSEHVGAGRVVLKHRAGRIREIVVQEGGDPVGACVLLGGDLVFVAAAHGQQAIDIGLAQVFARVLGAAVRKDVHELFLQREEALLLRKPDGRCREGLGEGKHAVLVLRAVGRPPPLRADLAMAQDHQAVHLDARLPGPAQEFQDGLGRNADRFR